MVLHIEPMATAPCHSASIVLAVPKGKSNGAWFYMQIRHIVAPRDSIFRKIPKSPKKISKKFQTNSKKILKQIPNKFQIIPKIPKKIPKKFQKSSKRHVKTGERKSIHHDSWPFRPMTALTSWFTTPPSIILSTLGKIFLRFFAWQDAKNTLLTDTLDFVQRIHNCKHWVDGEGNQCVLTSFDLTAMYTNFRFSDLSKAFCYWRAEWKNTCRDNFEITLHERAYVRCLSEPIGERWFSIHRYLIPIFQYAA